MNPGFRPEMAGLSDSVIVGILLLLVFGAAAFYLYSRMSQNEKRLSLLENLLLTLKISTEASLGPDTVEGLPVESQADAVNEEEYANMLKATPAPAPASPQAKAQPSTQTDAEAEELLRSIEVPSKTEVNANYESMTLKELQALARERGIPSSSRKKELIESLKHGPAPPTHMPLLPAADDLQGSEKVEGFSVNLDE